jgi:thioredoxin reductase (NADPH)
MVAQMTADPRITVRSGWQLAGLEGTPPNLGGVRIAALDGTEDRLDADALIALFGLASDLEPLRRWGVVLESGAAVVDPATCATSRPGVHAIGDLAGYPGKRKLILTGFAEAAVAAEAVFARVHPDRPLRHEHSTTRGAPVALAEPALV